MILSCVLLSAAGAVALSELLGRGKVVYTRMLTLVGSYVLCCATAGLYLAAWQGGGLTEFAAVALSGIPLMAAWLGFRIHVSNSITLEMATLLEDGRPRTLGDIEAAYDVDGHTASRVRILQAGGYLAPDAEARLTATPKSRAVLLLIRALCGPEGPRGVASTLRRRDLPEEGNRPPGFRR